MKRFLSSVLGVLMTLPAAFLAPAAAIADGSATTGSWVWTDISNQLTVRTNRPAWAVAYANSNWFYTDGQDLWNGGQVYRYDGYTQINITHDVRNAGLARVDDIVSDGETILFLQDVVRSDNQLSVVTYRNGQYTNITSQVRNGLQSDEGVSSINGRAGEWMVVTTKARLLRLTNSGVATQITLPSNIAGNIEGTNATMRYNVNHGSALGGVGHRVSLAIVPVTNGQWLLIADTWNNDSRIFRYHNNNFTEITSLFPSNMGRVIKIVSNGTLALLSTDRGTMLTNATSRADVSGIPYGGDGNDIRTGWNGKSWLILVNKNVYRVENTLSTQTATNYNVVRDLFLQAAGDNNGRLLLVGAQSELWNPNPTTPLTAKLVMVTEGVTAPRVSGVTDNGNRVYTSTYGPRISVQGNPADFRIGEGKEFNYEVVATDPDGVNRIDLYVNDALIRTCLSETTCSYRTTYWTNGATTRTVKFWARAIDRYGNITETASHPDNLIVDLYGQGTATDGQTQQPSNPANTQKNPAVWDWLEPNVTFRAGSEGTDYRVGAWDEDGLARIEILVNGANRRTCELGIAYGNRECSFWIQASDYTRNTDVYVNARAIDRYGNVTWTNGKTIRIGDNGATSGNVWVTANKQTYNYGDLLTFTGHADSTRAVDRMDIYLNDIKVETCEDTRTCATRTGPFFTDIPLRARAVLVAPNGNTITSPEITVTRN